MEIKEKFCETKYGKICYFEYGKGKRTAVFFHGFLGGPVNGESLAKKLSDDGWRVLVPYLPGHGKSFDIPQKYGFRDLAETMVEFLNKTVPEGAVLAGHSLGGALAWEIAARKPKLVKKLILVDPGLEVSRRSFVIRWLKAIRNDLLFDWKAWRRIYPAVWNFRALNLVKKIEVSELLTDAPVLLLCGKKDKVTPMKDYEKKLNGLKSLKVQIFDGGHHWYQWQEGKYLQVVEDFL